MFKKIARLIKAKKEDHNKSEERIKSNDDLKKVLILMIFGLVLLLNLLFLIFPYIHFNFSSLNFSANSEFNSDAITNVNFSQQNKACYNNRIGHTDPPPPIPSFQWHNTGLITLWFDDGWISQFSTVAPILEQEGLKAAESIALKFVCSPYFMNWEQIAILQNKGWEITSHSVTHNCNLDYYNEKTTEKEASESKNVLKLHQLRADNFVMPCGYSRDDIDRYFIGQNPAIIETIKKYYRSYRTTVRTKVNPLPVIDPYNLYAFAVHSTTSDEEIQNYINMAVKQKGWAIFVFHQVDDTGRLFSVNVPQFKKILAMIKASGLPVVLPSQALSVKDVSDVSEIDQKKHHD